ncbi:MAG: nucleotidyltransferase domain-containing protein [Nocardioides sp.]
MQEQTRPEPYDAAATFVEEEFPDALAAFVGGSVLTEHRTPTSDLDVVVVLDGPSAPYRETFWRDGWVIEAMVHTRASLEAFWDHDRDRRVATMMRLCAESLVVTDPAGVAEEIRAAARERLEAGPGEVSEEGLERLRYRLSDVLEDLAGADREDELAYVAGLVLARTADLALVAGGHWSGTGKALARALREVDPDLAERLVNAHRMVLTEGDTAPLYRCALQVLAPVGGPLLAGYRLEAPPELRG